MASNDDPSDETEVEQKNSFLVRTLDEIERQVEELRDNAKKMQEQKKTMLSTLNTLLQSQALMDISKGKV